MSQPTGQESGTPAEQPPAPGASADPNPHDPVDVDALPANVQNYIKTLRAENASTRNKAKANAAEQARNEVLQQIGQALGITEGTPDPEALTEQLSRSQQDAMSAQLELQVYRTAVRLGADADRLLDSRSFCDKVDRLDPDKDFGEQVEALIRAEVGSPSFDGGARTTADAPADMNSLIRRQAGLG